MSIIAIFTSIFDDEQTMTGFDAVLTDLYERASIEDDRTETVGILTRQDIERVVDEGFFGNRVEIHMDFRLQNVGTQSFTFPMPEDPSDETAEFNQFIRDIGFADFEEFLSEVEDGGVSVPFTRVTGEWRPEDRVVSFTEGSKNDPHTPNTIEQMEDSLAVSDDE